MARLDPYIAAMFRHSAEALLLVGGRRPVLEIGGVERPVSGEEVDWVKIPGLLAEIAPAELRQTVSGGGTATFVYATAAGSVQVETKAGGRATLRPTGASGTAAAAAGAPAAAGARTGVASAIPAGGGASPSAAAGARGTAPAAAPAGTAGARPAARPGAPLLERLLVDVVGRGGSDLHLSSGSRPLMRIDGDMTALDGHEALDAAAAERALLEIAPQQKREEFKQGGDTDFAYEIPGLCRFRCNLFLDRKGPGGVFRAIPSQLLSAEQLGLSREVCDLAGLTKGLVLVTGPTGSGKSTTLATMVDLANATRSDHLITIEDPIEFVHANKRCLVNQREVHVHTQSFKRALRAALREDPDIVLVGELRDLETIAIAIETAETGHLVFGTLHTSSAVSTVDRIIDQFPADRQEQIRTMLSESLKAVIAQVLCKKVGGGRVAALEVLMVNAAVSNLIREGKTFQIPSIMQTGKKLGMVLLHDALADLVQKKLVEPREAYVKAIDKASLVSALRGRNVALDFLEPAKREPQPA